MKVKQQDLSEVMLSVFNELNLPEGGRISLESIRQAWRHTGLRESDVGIALEQLQADGSLESVATAQGDQAFRITDAGFKAMVKISSGRSFLLSRAERLRRQAEKRVATPGVRKPNVERRH